jgi:hypothetical protein
MHTQLTVTTIFSCLLMLSTLASAQVSTRRVRDLVDLVTNKVEENHTDQVLMIMIDYVRRDGSATQSYYLSSGDRYRVVAAGDENRIKDIDLTILSEYGTEIDKDHDEKNIAICQFRPTRSGTYKFRVKPYTMASGVNDGFYGLVISRIIE